MRKPYSTLAASWSAVLGVMPHLPREFRLRCLWYYCTWFTHRQCVLGPSQGTVAANVRSQCQPVKSFLKRPLKYSVWSLTTVFFFSLEQTARNKAQIYLPIWKVLPFLQCLYYSLFRQNFVIFYTDGIWCPLLNLYRYILFWMYMSVGRIPATIGRQSVFRCWSDIRESNLQVKVNRTHPLDDWQGVCFPC